MDVRNSAVLLLDYQAKKLDGWYILGMFHACIVSPTCTLAASTMAYIEQNIVVVLVLGWTTQR